jgi:hypothetical protein
MFHLAKILLLPFLFLKGSKDSYRVFFCGKEEKCSNNSKQIVTLFTIARILKRIQRFTVVQ